MYRLETGDREMTTRDEYADQLRPLTLEGCYGKVVALIRYADIDTIGDDAAFREEVRTILDAHGIASDERVARLASYVEQRDAPQG